MIQLPHEVDQDLLVEDYERLPVFLRGADEVRPRERTNGNGEFFHIVAGQWLELASLQYVFVREPAEIVATAKKAVEDFVVGLEMDGQVGIPIALDFFSAAVAINDRRAAHVITSAPEELLGLLDDPEDPMALIFTTALTLAADEDEEARLNLEMLHGVLFEAPLDKAYQARKKELVSLYRLMSSILADDGAAFDKHLLERCRMRQDVFNGDPADDKPPVVDWTALALVCLARERGLQVTVQHVYVPFAIIEAARTPARR